MRLWILAPLSSVTLCGILPICLTRINEDLPAYIWPVSVAPYHSIPDLYLWSINFLSTSCNYKASLAITLVLHTWNQYIIGLHLCFWPFSLGLISLVCICEIFLLYQFPVWFPWLAYAESCHSLFGRFVELDYINKSYLLVCGYNALNTRCNCFVECWCLNECIDEKKKKNRTKGKIGCKHVCLF